MKYDFADSLKVEQRYEHLAQQSLEYFFPGSVIMRNDGGATREQFNGEDYSIILPNGKQITVDVKADTNPTTNMVIEFWNLHHDGRPPTPGWALKPTTNDYILYQFVKHGVSYLLDKHRLMVAANQLLSTWRQDYRRISIPNRTFDTTSLLIPTSVIENLFGTFNKHKVIK